MSKTTQATQQTAFSGISLKTQLYGLIIFFGLVSFIAMLLINVNSTREYLNEQMSIQAQDTATSLGLSISPYLDEENLVIAETMTNAIFDSGYYAAIKLISPDKKVIIERTNPKTVEGVPTWFRNLFELTPPTMGSEVNNGWTIAGTLFVTSHAGISYLQLWHYSLKNFYNSLTILLLSLLLARVIINAVLRPLHQVEQQALAITNKHFVINKNIPFTKELRTVTMAINVMVNNIQKTFNSMTEHAEKLVQDAYIDKLTQIGNRRAFENQFKEISHDSNSTIHTTVALVTLPSLSAVNTELGFTEGDNYVLKVIELLNTALTSFTNVKYFRIAGGSFIVIIPSAIELCSEQLEALKKTLNTFNSHRYKNNFATIVATPFSAHSNMGKLLSTLDTLSTEKNIFTLTPSINNKKTPSLGLQQWKELINKIIKSGDVCFSYQPIMVKNQDSPLYLELFSGFTHNNEVINNGQIFAMAERLNLMLELDKKLIMEVVKLPIQNNKQRIAINLSDRSIHDAEFIAWLNQYINQYADFFTHVVFEINESSLLCDVSSAKKVITLLKQHGIKICIERFGATLCSFKYLRGLNVDYVKLDGSYIRDLIKNPDNNYFIQAVSQICQGLGIRLIACHIENEPTFNKINDLAIDCYQGRFIQMPYKFNIKAK
ncbi:MAG: EAL domain-containing protein [Alteromonadaceae bacterium]|nr:EAL domain-containing protein [Alteromonadaceae bacterium]